MIDGGLGGVNVNSTWRRKEGTAGQCMHAMKCEGLRFPQNRHRLMMSKMDSSLF